MVAWNTVVIYVETTEPFGRKLVGIYIALLCWMGLGVDEHNSTIAYSTAQVTYNHK
jgi:hypothetical protein